MAIKEAMVVEEEVREGREERGNSGHGKEGNDECSVLTLFSSIYFCRLRGH